MRSLEAIVSPRRRSVLSNRRGLSRPSSLGVHYRSGAARDAHGLVVFVLDANFPHLAPASHMRGHPDRRERPTPLGSDVAGVDLRPESDLPRWTVQECAYASHALRQHHAHPTMKIPERLVVPLVHRHRRYYPLRGELHELDAEVLSDTLTTLDNGLYVHGPAFQISRTAARILAGRARKVSGLLVSVFHSHTIAGGTSRSQESGEAPGHERETQPRPPDTEQDLQHGAEGAKVPRKGDQAAHRPEDERQQAPGRQSAFAGGSNGEEDRSHGQNEQPEPEGVVSWRRHDKDVVDPEPIQADIARDDQDEPHDGHEEPQFLQQAGTL